MRLSDVLGSQVVDVDGRPAGHVRDVRLVQDGPLQGAFGAGLRVAGLVVGPNAVSSRLGYDRRPMRAPWLVAALARRASRGVRYVEWDEVDELADRVVTLSCSVDDLGAPPPLSGGRVAS